MPDQTTITLVAEKLAPFHGADERLGTLLALCVGRLMLKAARGGQDWRSICRDEDVRHVADWLKAAIVNDAGWLRNVDEHGRPRKLLKFGTMESLLREADKAMRIEAQKLRGVKLGDERVVTNEGPMSAAKFRVEFSRNRAEQVPAAIGFG